MIFPKEDLPLLVDMVIVDPWEVVTVNGSGPFSGKMVQMHDHEGRLISLLELEKPLRERSQGYKYFIAAPRHEGDSFAELKHGRKILCNLTAIPEEKAKSGNPGDLSWWRGGLVVIADMELRKETGTELE